MNPQYLLIREFLQENLFEDIQKMLNQLSPKERDVLIMRFGLTMTVTAKLLRKSARVTVYQESVLDRLKTVQ